MKRAFKVKYKALFITFKRLSVTKNCLRPESASLRHLSLRIILFKISPSNPVLGIIFNYYLLERCNFVYSRSYALNKI